jgi:hypothetical protein
MRGRDAAALRRPRVRSPCIVVSMHLRHRSPAASCAEIIGRAGSLAVRLRARPPGAQGDPEGRLLRLCVDLRRKYPLVSLKPYEFLE